ncbi:MAG: amidohydrolase [Parvularculaceae bacterium]|nr:amidohydrolase [Parvularculaceae bacterium]
MKKHHLSAFALSLVLSAAACGDKTATSPDVSGENAADKIFYGGVIYTGVAGQPTVEAVAVEDGRVTAVGDKAAIESAAGPETERVDLNGAAMYPGFVDAHAHLLGIGMRELTLNLEGVGSVSELVDIAAAAAQETKEGDVIYGRGWIETGWPEGRFPNRADLDAASTEHPIIFTRADGHALVANSASIEKAGVTKDTPDPDGGRIERDANGEPTGMFIDNAMELISAQIAAPSDEQRREAYEIAGDVYAARGWSGLHNVSVNPPDVSLMEEEAAAGRLNIRIYNALDRGGYDALAAQTPRVNNSGRIVTRAIKLYADGALGSRGAALSEPYSDMPQTSGLMLAAHDDIEPFLQQALRDGVQIATHAIGDRGNKLVLDWYEEAFEAVPAEERKVANPRWRVEHAQILHEEDIPRFARLGVIASMEPSHAIGDLYFAPARLGDARLDGAYAWRSLLDAGAVIAGGSDAPVERGDPLVEFYAAVARKDLEGHSGADWRPDEKVTREEALAMFTSANAYASFQEKDLGTIETGKKADFTVFSSDIMTVPEAEILKAKAVMTVVDGDIIFRAAD